MRDFSLQPLGNFSNGLHKKSKRNILIKIEKQDCDFHQSSCEINIQMMIQDLLEFHSCTAKLRVSWRATNENRDFLSWKINSVTRTDVQYKLPLWMKVIVIVNTLYVYVPPFIVCAGAFEHFSVYTVQLTLSKHFMPKRFFFTNLFVTQNAYWFRKPHPRSQDYFRHAYGFDVQA